MPSLAAPRGRTRLLRVLLLLVVVSLALMGFEAHRQSHLSQTKRSVRMRLYAHGTEKKEDEDEWAESERSLQPDETGESATAEAPAPVSADEVPITPDADVPAPTVSEAEATPPTPEPTIEPTTISPPSPDPTTAPTPAPSSSPPAIVETRTDAVPPAATEPTNPPVITQPTPVATHPIFTAWPPVMPGQLPLALPFTPTPAPTPAPTKDQWLPKLEPFPRNATLHNASFIMRSAYFDESVARDKGLILCLHDNALALGLSLIRELRCLGSNELIQVYHCLPQDLSLASRETLLRSDNRLEIIDVCSDLMAAGVFTMKNATQFKSWWAKPLAVHHTKLQELLLLDADAILLRDPSILRESPGYRQNGTVFFYDRVIEERSFLASRLFHKGYAQLLQYITKHFDYQALGLSEPQPSHHLVNSMAFRDKSSHEMDSSVVAIDKRRAGKAMETLWWLITKTRFTAEFSWGDKEAFWLAYELAQQPYAFSPWGVSVVSSSTNEDMENHPDTLCGSIAQYMPVNETDVGPELLYVNGRALLDPIAQGVRNVGAKPNILYNANPTHLVPRMTRRPKKTFDPKTFKSVHSYPNECLVGLGSTPLPTHFAKNLFRRRLHYLAISSGVLDPLQVCEFSWHR